MRAILLAILLFCSTNTLLGQENEYRISKGNIYRLSEPVGHTYKHIDFPRRNIIIKRGAIADYNALIGMEIVVKDLVENPDGSTTAILERKDGHPFFRFFQTVEANLEKALVSGELKR
ncbi:hypothetical protein OO009_04295 [Flavobacteriaceae bacterium KMM 6897]|nr:hypothetical protein [Flavobacteriaceae bacterium KMM 6897]